MSTEELSKKEQKKQAKAEKKANKKPMTKTGMTVMTSITALICVIAVCITATLCTNKITDALGKAVEIGANEGSYQGESGDENQLEYNPNDNSGSDLDNNTGDTAGDANVSGDLSGDTGSGNDNGSSGTNNPGSSGNSGNTTTTTASGVLPTTKADIVALYKSAAAKTRALPKFSVKKSETVAIKVDSMKPNLTDLANKVVESYAGTNTYTETFSNGKGTSDTKATVSGWLAPINLDPAGARTAVAVKDGNGTKVTIQVVPEKATLTTKPKYHSQCMSPLDLSTIDLFGLNITQADFNYSGGTLVCKINSAGYMTSLDINMPLSGTGGGKFIGISVEATVSGSFKQTTTYSW